MKKAISYIAIVLFACSLLLYNKYGIPQAVQMPLEEDSGEYTTDGFETPEEAVTYLLYHMNQDHLDAALRVCAISDIAEYFNMTLFLQYTQQYGGATMVLPSTCSPMPPLPGGWKAGTSAASGAIFCSLGPFWAFFCCNGFCGRRGRGRRRCG